ncbi:hypothetical protein BV25DRAFT_1921809 [Artomyces pyxidatus]|uniref:Uncharacterized protein n=1 Tax=Artomyces pyxidatus TaxID=48021 RepID=A0ACB8SID1_9AGAM|nr:hypothetical protein BV25DRAFT_1921809 [Artomyces pyxidatus]
MSETARHAYQRTKRQHRQRELAQLQRALVTSATAGKCSCVIVDREERTIAHPQGLFVPDEPQPAYPGVNTHSVSPASRFTFGGGPTAPHNRAIDKKPKKVKPCLRLTSNEVFTRLAEFAPRPILVPR